MNAGTIRRRVCVLGRNTAIRLERDFWDGLHEMAASRRKTEQDLINDIARQCRPRGLTDGIRLAVMNHFRRAAA